MTTYYRNEYLFSEIYLQEITQQPEDTEILASLTTLKEYREFARTATIQEWKESFVHEVLYALRFNIKAENERLTLLYPVGNMETPLTLCYVLLPTEDLDDTAMGRNWAEKVIRSLRHHNLKWGLLTNGEQWRMYHLDESTPYEIFLEINLAAILSDSASQAYQIFHKFMKVENFTIGEQGQCRLEVFKKESLAKIDYIESELANALKQKEEGGKGVLSNLCMGYVEFLKTSGSPNFDDDALRGKIYHGAMLYMFRLLFLFYADARGLLNETNSKLLNDVLRRSKASSANNTSASGYSIWEDLERIFVDIDQSYNGGLFDPHESEFTQFIEESRVNNSHLASALHYLTSYQERSGEEKAISYRDMSVRHLGTLYEGLLEHKLFITKEDTEVRAAKDKIQFIPASLGGKIVAGRYIPAGQVYFGSDRSERKATGSYYTPEYIVDYIVRNTVGEKLSQLRQDFLAEQKDLLSAVGKAIDQKERKALTELLEDNLKTFIREKVLKLSVLDPAMGSGHFLVNTSNFIANFITEILNECAIIGTTDTSTTHWRRWVVENCVYGVDVNPLAVELAKLSLWILSMSKEKPLSFLNHRLKTGNSLIGARLDDIGKYPGKAEKKQHSVFSDDRDFKQAVGRAISNYTRITSTDSATLEVIADKKAWLDEIDDILKPYKLVCDMHTSIYFGNEISEWKYKELVDSEAIIPLPNMASYFHWELEFPETFFVNLGFDVVIGNPPYLDSENMVLSGLGSLRDFISQRYATTKGNWDIYIAFMEIGFKMLSHSGMLSFITPDKWISKPFGDELRRILFRNINSIFDVGRGVFETSKVDSIVTKFTNKQTDEITIFSSKDAKIDFKRTVNKSILAPPYALDVLFSDSLGLISKIEKDSIALSKLFPLCENACATSDAYKLKEIIFDLESDSFFNNKKHLKIINTGTIDKYVSRWGSKSMTYLKDKYLFPVVEKDDFFQLFKNTYSKKSIKPKIIIKGLTLLDACLDNDGTIIPGKSTMIITSDQIDDLKCLLALLNSKIYIFYIKQRYSAASYNGGISFTKEMINNLPMKKLSSQEKKILIKLIDKILSEKQKDRSSNVTEYESEMNKMIFDMYNLDEDERELIEHN